MALLVAICLGLAAGCGAREAPAGAPSRSARALEITADARAEAGANALLDAGMDAASEAGAGAAPVFAPLERRAGLVAGAAFTCLLRGDGQVLCWGSNRFGQLGDPELAADLRAHRLEAAPVLGLPPVSRISAGSWHACAIDELGALYCWGHGGFGQLGSGLEDGSAPRRVQGLPPLVEVAAGQAHTCGIDREGRVHCFGANDRHQLGIEGLNSRSSPAMLEGLRGAVRIVAGRAHTCVLDSEGHVRCWGEDVDAQLGSGARSAPGGHRAIALPVVGLEGARAIWGGAASTCAALEGDEVRCWGRNDSAQLGASGGEAEAGLEEATPSEWGRGALEIALGSRHTCARSADGTVSCRGLNHRGQLADGSRHLRRSSVRIPELRGIRSIAAGVAHTCLETASGAILCAGDNRRGQLGAAAPPFSAELLPVPLAASSRSAGAQAEPRAGADAGAPRAEPTASSEAPRGGDGG